MPRSAPAKAPTCPRKASWLAALGPSMEMEQRMMPESRISRALSAVIRVPLGAMTQRRPWPAAWRTSLKMSGRSRGSPPVKMTMGDPVSGKVSMSALAAAVSSSPA